MHVNACGRLAATLAGCLDSYVNALGSATYVARPHMGRVRNCGNCSWLLGLGCTYNLAEHEHAAAERTYRPSTRWNGSEQERRYMHACD